MKLENCKLCYDHITENSLGRRLFCSKKCALIFAGVEQRVKRQNKKHKLIMEGKMCERCKGRTFDLNAQKYCHECKLIARKERRKMKFIESPNKTIQCNECKKEVIQTNFNMKYCLDCKEIVKSRKMTEAWKKQQASAKKEKEEIGKKPEKPIDSKWLTRGLIK